MNLINKVTVGLQTLIKPEKLFKKPFWLGVEVSRKCNSKCRTCGWSKYIRTLNNKLFMNLAEFEIILNKVKPNILSIVGMGEILLNKDIFKMIKYATDKGITTYTTTNGILLKNCSKDLNSVGLTSLTISMDGYDNETYKKIRGVDQFTKITEGIDSLNYERSKQNSKLITCFQTVIQDDNYINISEIVELAKKYEVSIISFSPMDIVDKYINNKKYINDINKEVLIKSIDKANKLAENYKISTNLLFWKNYFQLIWNKLHSDSETDVVTGNIVCHHPWSSIYINLEGNVMPCCMLLFSDYPLGNIFNEDIIKILNSKKAIDFRKSLIERKKPFLRCKHCLIVSIYDLFKDMQRRKIFDLV